MPDTIDPQEFGAYKAKVDLYAQVLEEVRADVKEMRLAIENARGGWKTLLLLGTMSAAIGAFVVKLLPFLR
jgi:hypothetical protein